MDKIGNSYIYTELYLAWPLLFAPTTTLGITLGIKVNLHYICFLSAFVRFCFIKSMFFFVHIFVCPYLH